METGSIVIHSTQSPEINELAKALVEFQKNLEPVRKDKNNPFFKSKYADLADCFEAMRKPLTNAGLAVIQMPTVINNKTYLKTRLLHTSGQWIESTIPIADEPNPQKLGSLISYLRRYTLQAITGQVSDDDDGNLASQSPKSTPKPQQTKPVGQTISEPQRKRLWAISKTTRQKDGKKETLELPKEAIKQIIAQYGYESTTEIKPSDYELICEKIKQKLETLKIAV